MDVENPVPKDVVHVVIQHIIVIVNVKFNIGNKVIINNIVSWSLVLEMLIIVSQAYRGVQSHYNMTTAYDGILFAAMGILIGINVLIMVLFAIDTLRLKMHVPRSVQTAILIGWLVVCMEG